jgi:predicted AlkP superfamily phosphohydrolase/phosphomutase
VYAHLAQSSADTGPGFAKDVVVRCDLASEVYSGPQSASGPDLILVSTPGFDLKGRLGAPQEIAPRRLQGMHTWDDAFVVTTRTDLLPGRELTLLDVAAMLVQSLGLEPAHA